MSGKNETSSDERVEKTVITERSSSSWRAKVHSEGLDHAPTADVEVNSLSDLFARIANIASSHACQSE